MMNTATRLSVDEQTIAVGLGDIVVTADPALSLACFGIGSCICLCAYDPLKKIAGMAHIVLPESKGHKPSEYATKYADVAVPQLLGDMSKLGAVKNRLVVKLIGGARMIQSLENSTLLDMGARNLEATKHLLIVC